MPQVIYPYFTHLLLTLLTGGGSVPATLYLGLRVDLPSASGGALVEIGTTTAAGYARVAVARSHLITLTAPLPSNPFQFLQIASAVAFPAFTGTPAPTGATHWFLTDTASGAGNLYASGPLNPFPRPGTLMAAAGSDTLTLATSPEFQESQPYENLQLYDYLYLGSACAGNLELVQIADIGSEAGPTTLVTLASPLLYSHPNGEAFARECSTRYYTSGFTERVSADVSFTALAVTGTT